MVVNDIRMKTRVTATNRIGMLMTAALSFRPKIRIGKVYQNGEVSACYI